MIARLRREYRMTGEAIALRLRLPRSIVASHFRRLGLGRLAALELVHRTSSSSPASAASATALEPALGPAKPDPWGNRRHGSAGAGWEFVHVAVDDASRLAHVEVLPDEKRSR